MVYRIEVAANARAGCKNKECKDAGVKIQKGELRFASQFTVHDHTSWAYKHWGCVTPSQIENLISESGGDIDMVDGYDELPADEQAKVRFALENGHVPDEDWKGDVECNRRGAKGFRAKAKKAPKKKGKQADEDDEEAEAPEPKPKGKRSRAAKEEDGEDEAPAPKKARGKGKKAIAKDEETPEAEDEAPAPKAKKAVRSKKAAVKNEVEDGDVEVPEPPKPKRGRKVAPKKEVDDEDAADEPDPPKPKRGKKAAATDGAEKAVPQKRSGRVKKAVNYEEE